MVQTKKQKLQWKDQTERTSVSENHKKTSDQSNEYEIDLYGGGDEKVKKPSTRKKKKPDGGENEETSKQKWK